jgi:hypothetical protein
VASMRPGVCRRRLEQLAPLSPSAAIQITFMLPIASLFMLAIAPSYRFLNKSISRRIKPIEEETHAHHSGGGDWDVCQRS